MAKSKYVDTASIIQVIGCIYNNPKILEKKDKYTFSEFDFPEEFHKILFGAIYNLYELGSENINYNTIEDYLSSRPQLLGIYKANKGREYLIKISDTTQMASFNYYYNKMKKMSLLRLYDTKIGMDLSWLYDPSNILDVKKKQAQEDWLDKHSLTDIVKIIDDRIDEARIQCAGEEKDLDAESAGEGIFDLLDKLKVTPEVGSPLFGKYVNAVTKGARLKKVYMRSAPTGVGKTRAMIADACYLACDQIFDLNENKWIQNGIKEPTVFITTEQEIDEVQTMMLAFLSGVNEDYILQSAYPSREEEERVFKAAQVLSESPLYIKELPDFTLDDIENVIKRQIRQRDVKYVILDYIHSSMSILSEISSKAGVKGLREDNILFMIGVKLKDIANQYGVFVLTATQLSANYEDAKEPNQNLLRGAKSLGDKIDIGEIMLPVTPDDREALQPILKDYGFTMPVLKISVYKNRRGKLKDIFMWCKADRGICRIEPMFITNFQYEIINVEDLKINVVQR